MSQGMRVSSYGEKGKEMDSPLRPSKGKSPADTLILVQRD